MDPLIEEKSRITGGFVDSIAPQATMYRPLEGRKRRQLTVLFSVLALALGFGFSAWLLISGINAGVFVQDNVWAVSVAVIAISMEFIRQPLAVSLAWSSVLAKMPVPVRQVEKLNVALGITFVPKSEDVDRLKELLIEAKKMTIPKGGRCAIFVFDEGGGKDPHEVLNTIDLLNAQHPGHPVYRVSRFGIPEYHQKKGSFETKTKHGNINAGMDYIQKHPEKFGTFDVLLGLDPDHIPMVSFVERMICYFNDPDVAYVAGPQAYANGATNTVAKLAESSQFMFHTNLQTAANTFGAPMLVGTSYAIRMTVFNQIGGIQPSITEDMATSFAILPRRNEKTGNTWKGVYTPDLLAHGEGPNTWGAFYKQQDRWSRGAVEFMVAGPFFKHMLGMWRKPLRVLHYSLLMCFYPIMGIVWLLAASNTILITMFGVSNAIVSPLAWVTFYGWAAVSQVWLYIWSRHNNVSPYETSKSWGALGMFMSVASAPVYANTLLKAALRRPVGFSVTPKGGQGASDTLYTFRINLAWVAFYVGTTVYATVTGVMTPALLFWPAVAIILSMAPVILWKLPNPVPKDLQHSNASDRSQTDAASDELAASVSA